MNTGKTIAIAAASVALATAIGVGAAAAQSGSNTTPLADKLASRFNLDKGQVQQVIDEHHQEREAKHEEMYTQRLDDAVKAGKLTSEQKDKLIAKHKELEAQREANRDAFKNMTPDERKAEMEKKKAELEQWAKDNGISSEYLMPGPGGRGHGHGMMRGEGGPGGPR